MNAGFKIEDLTITYFSHDRVAAVKGVSFDTKPGECVALIGKTGSGKTTIAKAIAGLLPGQAKIDANSRIWFGDKEIHSILETNRFDFRRNVRYIFQQPLECFNPIVRCGKQLTSIIKLHERVKGQDIYVKMKALLDKVRLTDTDRMLSAYPHELSLGQLQRLNMAMAIAGSPKVILADEPLASVDAINRNEIIGIFRELQNEFGITLMIISHDLQLVDSLASRWIVLKDGAIIDQGEGFVLKATNMKDYTRQMVSAYRELLTFETIKRKSESPILEVKDLTFNYKSEKKIWNWHKESFEALRNIDLTLFEEDSLGIIGESGSGKSTLAMIIGGLLYPGPHKLFLSAKEISADKYASRSYYKKIQYILQEAESSLAPKRRIGKILTDVVSAFEIETTKKIQIVLDILHDLGLSEGYFNRFSHELSGGEKQRVAFARALLVQPEILILDESFSGLDRKTLHDNLQILISLQSKYSFATILISHDISLIGHFCNRVMVIKDGCLIEEGLKENLLTNPVHPYTKKLIEAAHVITF